MLTLPSDGSPHVWDDPYYLFMEPQDLSQPFVVVGEGKDLSKLSDGRHNPPHIVGI